MKCSGCKFPIQRDVHSALGRQWHRNCFRFACLYFGSKWLISCLLMCLAFVVYLFILFVLSRCSECLSTIPLHYVPRDNVLYCKKDYILKFGEHCQRCNEQITGPVMVRILTRIFIILSLIISLNDKLHESSHVFGNLSGKIHTIRRSHYSEQYFDEFDRLISLSILELEDFRKF